LDTDQFTRQGLNLNSRGKKISTKKTGNTIQDISNEKKIGPVTMK